MKYYKLSMDLERENDIVCYYKGDFEIPQNTFIVGKSYEGEREEFEFYYKEQEGEILTDYLANDKGWFLVSKKLYNILKGMNTEIQFYPIQIKEKNMGETISDYYIANIIRVVDALCLENSDYFKTEIPGGDVVYTVSKYGIYAEKTRNSDVFKLSKRQEIPIFVSERFKKAIEAENITGICLKEICVA